MKPVMVLFVVGLLVVFADVGCDRRERVEVYDDDYYEDYDMDDHICTVRCDHYYDDDRFIRLRQHRHGPGCGHVLREQRWIAVYAGHSGPSRPIRHVCTRDCHHHYHDGSRLVELRRHRHGPGCGHVWNDRYWVTGAVRRPSRQPHVCNRNCNEHYYDGNRIVVLNGHRHGRGCGHVWDGSHWVAVRPPARRPAGHVCTPACQNHYFNGERVIVLQGHRHGERCGHAWNGSNWVAAPRRIATIPVGHVCSRACVNHLFDGNRVVVLSGHQHGPNCGHVWKGRYWVRKPASVRRRR